MAPLKPVVRSKVPQAPAEKNLERDGKETEPPIDREPQQHEEGHRDKKRPWVELHLVTFSLR